MDAKGQWVTLGLMAAVFALIISSDVFLSIRYGVHATYSRVAAHLLDEYPVVLVTVVFFLGVLIGHVLLPTYPR